MMRTINAFPMNSAAIKSDGITISEKRGTYYILFKLDREGTLNNKKMSMSMLMSNSFNKDLL